jgi:hypothetical protein
MSCTGSAASLAWADGVIGNSVKILTFLQRLIVAIFASAMFFFACAGSRAGENDATWTLYGNITGLPIDGPFSTEEKCQADRARTVPPTDYTCYLTGSQPTPRGSRAEEGTTDDTRGPPWVYVLVSHRDDELQPVGVFGTAHECENDINERKATAQGGSAGSYAAGLECVEYSRINLDNGGEDKTVSRAQTLHKVPAFLCTLTKGLPRGADFRCEADDNPSENETTDDGGGWILSFHQLGRSAPPPDTLYDDHDECLAAGYKGVLDFHRRAQEALTFNCLPRTEGGPNPVTKTWTLMVTYPYLDTKGEYASKPAGPTEYITLSRCLEAGKKMTGYMAVGCEHH